MSEIDLPADLQPAKKITVLKGHGGWVMAVAFSPSRNAVASGAADGTIRLWDLSEGRPRERFLPPGHQGNVNSLAFSPDSKLLAVGSGAIDGPVWLWDLAGARPEQKAALRGHNAPVDALAFSPDGTLLVSGGDDRTVRLWDMTGGEPRERAVLWGHTDFVK